MWEGAQPQSFVLVLPQPALWFSLLLLANRRSPTGRFASPALTAGGDLRCSRGPIPRPAGSKFGVLNASHPNPGQQRSVSQQIGSSGGSSSSIRVSWSRIRSGLPRNGQQRRSRAVKLRGGFGHQLPSDFAIRPRQLQQALGLRRSAERSRRSRCGGTQPVSRLVGDQPPQ
jgi:hypothetical protein